MRDGKQKRARQSSAERQPRPPRDCPTVADCVVAHGDDTGNVVLGGNDFRPIAGGMHDWQIR